MDKIKYSIKEVVYGGIPYPVLYANASYGDGLEFEYSFVDDSSRSFIEAFKSFKQDAIKAYEKRING